jgi:hypothetical protein
VGRQKSRNSVATIPTTHSVPWPGGGRKRWRRGTAAEHSPTLVPAPARALYDALGLDLVMPARYPDPAVTVAPRPGKDRFPPRPLGERLRTG